MICGPQMSPVCAKFPFGTLIPPGFSLLVLELEYRREVRRVFSVTRSGLSNRLLSHS